MHIIWKKVRIIKGMKSLAGSCARVILKNFLDTIYEIVHVDKVRRRKVLTWIKKLRDFFFLDIWQKKGKVLIRA